ncbi:MAG: hypothetical protein AB4368_09335 [Xenococcaceae cyanobacterium]
MNNTTHLSFEQQLESLSLILEHWLPVLEEMELIEKNIEDLPYELDKVRQCIHDRSKEREKNNERNWLNSVSLPRATDREQALYLKLENILSSLDREIPHLLFLEEKIKNVLCLREVTEALQEHIKAQASASYLVELEKNQKTKQFKQLPQPNRPIWQPLVSFWHNLINPKRFNKKMKFVFFFGLILVWNIVSNFIYTQVVDNNLNNQVSNMEHRLENIQIHNFVEPVENW